MTYRRRFVTSEEDLQKNNSKHFPPQDSSGSRKRSIKQVWKRKDGMEGKGDRENGGNKRTKAVDRLGPRVDTTFASSSVAPVP
ncbi:hypothetical protein E2562_035059 [Oryza meyeriana var. granulata]|uniref:Uncharacterized protein n=1 Tax=Oryza meyeriana var. granulata TaxID=110450 RepID=A0A6G1CKV7_9ORYZ|nr:hypothetical protein E2562_035059 [Oryza meyeriana var. granulata]